MHDGRGIVMLDGMRIVEVSAFVAVPFAGMTLAQMGADVIRVDLPQGGLDRHRWPVTASGESLFWAGMNKGKRSFTIDFQKPEGAEVLAALIAAAGAFMTNLRGRGTLDWPALQAARADLVMLALAGTRRGEPAVDYTVNPALGFPMATGAPDGPPVAHVLPAWDLLTGQTIATALLAADRHRLRTGEGQLIEMNLKDIGVAAMGHLGIIGEVLVNGVDRPRVGNALYGAFGQDFLCACGARVMVIGLTHRQWTGLVRVTGTEEAMDAIAKATRLDLAREGDRWAARSAIAAALVPWFAARTLAEIGPVFDKAGLTWAPFRSFAQAVRQDPDLSPDNPMMHVVDQPGIGPLPVPGLPFATTAAPRAAPAAAPRLGADTHAILADMMGLSDAQIGGLIDRGIVPPG
jgi:2-methylfumaryl-CoA isomerase